MAINKVVYGNEVLIDLTNDSITPDSLVEGFIAHGASGDSITGTNPYEKQITDETVDIQADLIEQIKSALNGKAAGSGGIVLPELSNPATASDILSDKEAIDKDGNKITGTIATKTSSDLTASGATVTVPAGYYASNASKSVSTATQATPTVSIDSAGKITASATQTAGYVSAGTKTGTKQLTTQAAKTITPSTSTQTAVASGMYTTGSVTVKGDSNLIAENIKSGVSIFGVNGTCSSGEDVTEETQDYAEKIAQLQTAVTALETELAGKASGGSGEAQTCTIDIHCPTDISCIGWGDCDMYLVSDSTETFLLSATMPTTQPGIHKFGFGVKYHFESIPVGSIFTFYESSGKGIAGATIDGDIEFSSVEYGTTTSQRRQFATCRCNGNGTITINKGA